MQGNFTCKDKFSRNLIRIWPLVNALQEQKRLQEQHATEQEAIFGSRPSIKKPLGQSTNANSMVGTPISRRAGTPLGRHGVSAAKERRESGRVNITPVNYVALPKDDSVARRN